MYNVSLQEWIKALAAEQNVDKKRKEQLLFDVASFILTRSKEYANKNFGKGIGTTARTSGRSGALRNSIQMARLSSNAIIVTAGGPGVPYARIHELGTKGKNGELPPIVPRVAGALTIPKQEKYVGRRAREFALTLVRSKDKKTAFLQDEEGKMAYLLVKRVEIPPRPYLKPAAEDLQNEAELIARVKLIYGTSKIPYEVVKI